MGQGANVRREEKIKNILSTFPEEKRKDILHKLSSLDSSDKASILKKLMKRPPSSSVILKSSKIKNLTKRKKKNFTNDNPFILEEVIDEYQNPVDYPKRNPPVSQERFSVNTSFPLTFSWQELQSIEDNCKTEMCLNVLQDRTKVNLVKLFQSCCRRYIVFGYLKKTNQKIYHLYHISKTKRKEPSLGVGDLSRDVISKLRSDLDNRDILLCDLEDRYNKLVQQIHRGNKEFQYHFDVFEREFKKSNDKRLKAMLYENRINSLNIEKKIIAVRYNEIKDNISNYEKIEILNSLKDIDNELVIVERKYNKALKKHHKLDQCEKLLKLIKQKLHDRNIIENNLLDDDLDNDNSFKYSTFLDNNKTPFVNDSVNEVHFNENEVFKDQNLNLVSFDNGEGVPDNYNNQSFISNSCEKLLLSNDYDIVKEQFPKNVKNNQSLNQNSNKIDLIEKTPNEVVIKDKVYQKNTDYNNNFDNIDEDVSSLDLEEKLNEMYQSINNLKEFL